MENKFKWSESGLQLLSEINIRIESHGGREKLINAIETEIAKFKPIRREERVFNFKKPARKFKKRELEFIIENHKKMTYQQIAIKLKRSYLSIRSKIDKLRINGVLSYKGF